MLLRFLLAVSILDRYTDYSDDTQPHLSSRGFRRVTQPQEGLNSAHRESRMAE